MGLLDDLDKRRESAENTRENSARMAQAYATFTTTGLGTFEYEERVPFGLTFVEKPVASYAAECDMDDLAEVLGISGDDVPLPLSSGFVTAWDRDERDFYVGCWVAVRVHYPLTATITPTATSSSSSDVIVPADAQPNLGHHFTFSAIGMKDIPPDLTDAGS